MKMVDKNTIKWKRLENVSKIFPATANNKDTKVFRLSCQLKEEVDPICLQRALDLTRESFPIYDSVLKRGAFWYYFESKNIRPLVSEESQALYAPIYLKDNKSLLYRVFYYKKRISVEELAAMNDTMYHRGPDDHGEEIFNIIFFLSDNKLFNLHRRVGSLCPPEIRDDVGIVPYLI